MRIVIYLYLIVAHGRIYLNADVYQFNCSVLLQTVFIIEQVGILKILFQGLRHGEGQPLTFGSILHLNPVFTIRYAHLIFVGLPRF